MKIKMKIALLFGIIFSLPLAHAKSSLISQLLETVKINSTQTKIAEQNEKSILYDLKGQKSIFNTAGHLRTSYSNRDSLPTSPFAPLNSNVKEYEAGIQKLWTSGIQTNLSYLVTDSATTFPGRPDFSFLSPTLQLEVSTNLIQSLFYNRYQHLFDNVEKREKLAALDGKREKKQTLVKSLLDLSVILEQKEELRLQKELCVSTEAQSRNLSQKRKRGTISRREYLISLKDLTNCQATIERLNRSYLENFNAFKSNYNTDLSSFASPNVDKLFTEAEATYQKLSPSMTEVKIEGQDDIQSIELQVESLKSKQAELEARAKTNLNLEFRTGLSGIDNSLADAQQDITDINYPFVYVGLKLDLPLENTQAKQESQANFYRLESLKNQRLLITEQKRSRFDTLKSTLKKDFIIYSKYKRSVEISKSIFKEAGKDFKNGRLDFNSLSEFNKGVLSDQKTLASHRIQLIVRVVEYLDFFQFFDTYL